VILQRLWRGYAPPWFGARRIATFFEAVGAVLDTEAQRVLDGRLAGIPYAGSDPGGARLSSGQRIECQPDALPYHATDRSLTLYATEPLRSQRVRLSQWRQLHARRGTPRGVLEHVQPYFLGALGTSPVPLVRVVHTQRAAGLTDWHTLLADGTYVIERRSYTSWDVGLTPGWAEFDVIIYAQANAVQVPALPAAQTYDGGSAYDDGSLWDGLAPAVIADIQSMVEEWHAAHARLRWIIVCDDESKCTPDEVLVTDASGWTSLPSAGNWLSLAYTSGPYLGHNTRPPYLRFIYDANA
jgi:hypothetical protein